MTLGHPAVWAMGELAEEADGVVASDRMKTLHFTRRVRKPAGVQIMAQSITRKREAIDRARTVATGELG